MRWARCNAGGTGSGSPAITIPIRRAGSAASSRARWRWASLAFCHAPVPDAPPGEIAGHLHPVARVTQRGRCISRRCFVSDGRRLVMPAFGAFTGGLNVRHPAFADVFGSLAFTAHLLGEGRLYALSGKRCLAD